MELDKIKEVLLFIRGFNVVVCIIAMLYCIWNFNWTYFKVILTLSIINYIISEFLKGIDNDDNDEESTSSESRLNQKIQENGN